MRQYKSEKKPLTYDDADKVLLNIAKKELEINALEAYKEIELLKVKDNYNNKIKVHASEKKALEKLLNQFCKSHRKEFEEKRSRKLTYGTIGIRTGQSALQLLSKKFTWEFTKNKLFDLFSNKYVNVKITLNKKKVIAAYDNGELNSDQLAGAGCRIVKQERSYYSINWDPVNQVEEEK